MSDGKVNVSYPRLALLALALLLAGALAVEIPSLYQDLHFLHLVRVYNEQQAAAQQAAAAAAQSPQRIDQSQVHPGPASAAPSESPPKGK